MVKKLGRGGWSTTYSLINHHLLYQVDEFIPFWIVVCSWLDLEHEIISINNILVFSIIMPWWMSHLVLLYPWNVTKVEPGIQGPYKENIVISEIKCL